MTAQTGIRDDPHTGSVLGGRYRLVERIGRGGMADVFRARDERLGRDVAVKVLREEAAGGDTLRRMNAEVAVLATLNHPSLVTLHDAAVENPPYLVMELVEGRSLDHETVEPAELAAIAADVAAALEHAHSRGVIHRDVKPANVLVVNRRDRRHGKLADLGIALIAGSTRLTADGSIMGTAAYLSPEQVRGEELTPANDIYALGLLLIERLTGRPAFPGTAGESLTARLVRPPAIPSGLAAADASLLAAMTAIDPASRPDAATVEHALRAWSSAGTEGTAQLPAPLGDATMATESPTLLLTAPSAAPEPLSAMTAVTTEPLTPTARAASATTAPTAAAPIPSTAAPDDAGDKRPRRRRTVAAVIAALVLAAVIALTAWLVSAATAPEPVPSRSYTPVEGPLGEHLTELQELVGP